MSSYYKMIRFDEEGFSLDVLVDPVEETVWLTQEEIGLLFDRDRTVISRHINNLFREGELSKSTSVHFLHRSPTTHSNRPPEYYNLDVIISVGYRVKSVRGIAFRRWTNSVLRQYVIEGYAINEKRLQVLNRTVEVQRALLTHYAEGSGADSGEVIRVLDRFTSALNMLMTMITNALRNQRKPIRRQSI